MRVHKIKRVLTLTLLYWTRHPLTAKFKEGMNIAVGIGYCHREGQGDENQYFLQMVPCQSNLPEQTKIFQTGVSAATESAGSIGGDAGGESKQDVVGEGNKVAGE